jgi:hypothetical protein
MDLEPTVTCSRTLCIALPCRPFPDCSPEQLVYIYELPPEYNVGLFGLDGPFGSPCQTFYGHHPRNACRVYDPLLDGHGPHLSEKESSRLRQLGTLPEAWADTGQFALEVMFHRVCLKLAPFHPQCLGATPHIEVYIPRLCC